MIDDSTQWKLVRLPFSKFARRTDFQPGGAPTDGKLDLNKMWGWAINLPSGAEAYSIDDVQVYQQVLTVEDFEGPKTVAQRGLSRVQRQQRAAHAGDRVPAARRRHRTTTR